MKKEVLIRRATIKDLEDILSLNLELFKKEHKEYDKKLDLKWTYGKIGKACFKKSTIDKNGFSIVAESDGKIIAYLCGSLKLSPYTYRIIPRYAELDNMFVAEKFRSKGIGEKLVKEFLGWCKEKKADCISVNASIQNEKAIKFYRSLGFKDYNLTLEMNR